MNIVEELAVYRTLKGWMLELSLAARGLSEFEIEFILRRIQFSIWHESEFSIWR